MKCLTCGYPIESSDINHKNNTAKCPACNNTWFIDELNNLSSSELTSEYKLFARLNQLLEFHQFSDVIKKASQHLDINPFSGSAHFFYFLGQARLTIADLSATTLEYDYRNKLIFINAKKYQNIYTTKYLSEYEVRMQELADARRQRIEAELAEIERRRKEQEIANEEARLKKLAEDARQAAEDEKREKRISVFGTLFVLLFILGGIIWAIIASHPEYAKNINSCMAKDVNSCVLYIAQDSPVRVALYRNETYDIKPLLSKRLSSSSSAKNTDIPVRYEADSEANSPYLGVCEITTNTITTTIYRLVGFTKDKPTTNLFDSSGTAWSLESYLTIHPEKSIIDDSIEYSMSGFTYYYPIYTVNETKISNSESKSLVRPTPISVSFDSEKIMDFNSKETILIPEATVVFGYPEAPELNITTAYTYTNITGYGVPTDSGFDSLYWTYHKLKLANSIMSYMNNTAEYKISDLETPIKIVVSGPYDYSYGIDTTAYVNIIQWSQNYLPHTTIDWILIEQ